MIVNGDCYERLDWLDADLLVTSPPSPQHADGVLAMWGPHRPAVFVWVIPTAQPRRWLCWDLWSDGGAPVGGGEFPWSDLVRPVWVGGFDWHACANKGRLSPILRVPPVPVAERLHPAEIPVVLLSQVLAVMPPGMVADPFAGSGSTLVAAQRLGRPWIGVERDPRYHAVAAARLAQVPA